MIRGLFIGIVALVTIPFTDVPRETYNINNIYSKSGIVYAVENNKGLKTIYFADGNGEGWSYKTNEHICIGDYVNCIMYDNNTADNKDDVIIELHNSGFSCEG